MDESALDLVQRAPNLIVWTKSKEVKDFTAPLRGPGGHPVIPNTYAHTLLQPKWVLFLSISIPHMTYFRKVSINKNKKIKHHRSYQTLPL